MGAFAGLEQLELRAPGDDLFAELDERLDDTAQVERLGPAAADREHVAGTRPLRGRVAPELVEHEFRRGFALEIDDNANSHTVRFDANVPNTFDQICHVQ